ncbi:nucleoside triphosphate pyrophosphohydrolase [Sandaracinobacteroides hominis]|uniref:nucleoside triphosphate pyrophosphohydrolase n=1 Tax=Sandaracinobacteroides hominis TaxID=2780086 RepID=UPI0018F5C350|nr:nucleoside triphosphate pyrophosphohydrolase [Sandaracinobacteroides hominis]
MNADDREQALAQIARLASIMERLRGPDGCEWDRAQTYASIAPYTLEEAYEVSDAIARNNIPDLQEELGDLLLQVIFHAQMASEAGHFTLADVAQGICDKMERRHPHIFRTDIPLCAEEVKANWETIKAAEKPRASALDGIALPLPALTRAEKLAARAARTGFDWPDAQGPLDKIHEELAEIAAAGTDTERHEEAGDLLFAVANYLRKLKIDPEDALRAANRKFERRFRAIEATPGFSSLNLEQQEALWQSYKSRATG